MWVIKKYMTDEQLETARPLQPTWKASKLP